MRAFFSLVLVATVLLQDYALAGHKLDDRDRTVVINEREVRHLRKPVSVRPRKYYENRLIRGPIIGHGLGYRGGLIGGGLIGGGLIGHGLIGGGLIGGGLIGNGLIGGGLLGAPGWLVGAPGWLVTPVVTPIAGPIVAPIGGPIGWKGAYGPWNRGVGGYWGDVRGYGWNDGYYRGGLKKDVIAPRVTKRRVVKEVIEPVHHK